MCVFQFWFPQGIRLGVALLGHMVVLATSCEELTHWERLMLGGIGAGEEGDDRG